jgi:hypothetical protein
MTMAATQDRACSTSLMNKGDEALIRLAASAIGYRTKRTCRSRMSAAEGKADEGRALFDFP